MPSSTARPHLIDAEASAILWAAKTNLGADGLKILTTVATVPPIGSNKRIDSLINDDDLDR